MLSLTTLNLLNDLTFWEERAPLILAGLRELSPDVVLFQEVALPFNSAAWLAERLEGYSLHLCPMSQGRGCCEGLAILSRLPVEGHEMLALGRQNRVAQRVIVRYKERQVMIANTHLFWSPVDDHYRLGQVEKIMNWLPDDFPVILAGDFNALPHYRAIRPVSQRLSSAYEAVHHRPPSFTCPTPLKRGKGLRHSARRLVLKAIGRARGHKSEGWRGVLDYIFFSPGLDVINCQVAFDRPSLQDSHIYASDHLGLYAEFKL